MSIVDRVRKILEDAPVNAVGSGNIAGAGIDAPGKPGSGEPGVSKLVQKKHRSKLLRRKSVMEEVEEAEFSQPKPVMGKFAGEPTFIVPHATFLGAKTSKKDRGWWSKYIDGEDHHIQNIRDYANKNPKKTVYLECERTGAIYCARHGKK